MRRAVALAVLLSLACGCTAPREPLPQDEFLADGVRVSVPPPPGLLRLRREEGRASGHADFAVIARFAADTPASTLARGASLMLPSRLGRDSTRHRERFELVRASWIAREQQEPSALEREARARLAAFDAGHADSAAWTPAGETRTLSLGLPLAERDAVVRIVADMPDRPGERVCWQIDAFVLARGRLLQLQCYDLTGAPLDAVPALREMARAWVERVRAANQGDLRHRGHIGELGPRRPQAGRPRSSPVA